jgi:DNA-binding NarL/FixJ family response regulator
MQNRGGCAAAPGISPQAEFADSAGPVSRDRKRAMLRFLVLDGDECLARVLAQCLANYGEITVVGTAQAALSACRNSSDWAAFVFDVRLPDGSGVLVLEELRKTYPQVPALVLSGCVEREDVNAAYRLGARYLVKPVPVADIERFARSVPLASRLASAAHAWADRYGLTPAEMDVLLRAAAGEDRETIARQRNSSLATVKSHIARVLEKTRDVGLLEAANRLLRESHP